MKKRLGSILTGLLFAVAVMAAIPAVNLATAVPVQASSDTYSVVVKTGYLALRSAPAFDSANEIGRLYNGDLVEVRDYSGSTYWWVYSYKYDRCGYVNNNYLSYSGSYDSGTRYDVSVSSGYLALRTAKAFDSRNEIGRLYNGDYVMVEDTSDPTYWWVYSPKYDTYGYVNRNYLSGSGSSYYDGAEYSVSVSSGYLALRSAKAFDSRNEIGKLYNGDSVYVQDSSDPTYWWVYSPKYDCCGYVNRNYLAGAGSSYEFTCTVSVASGYLALRSAPSFDSRNEIGCLYSGDTVQVIDSSGSTYWWVYSPKLGKSGYVNKNYLY